MNELVNYVTVPWKIHTNTEALADRICLLQYNKTVDKISCLISKKVISEVNVDIERKHRICVIELCGLIHIHVFFFS